MSSRNAIEVYDGEAVMRQQTLAVRATMEKSGIKPGDLKFDASKIDKSITSKVNDLAAAEARRFREREEERRRRDPTYRPDALDFDITKAKEFDVEVNYYRQLEVSQFCSQLEVKAAFKKMAVQLHPDKQVTKSADEAAAAKARFDAVTAAHAVLSDMATRRAYDRARDTNAARGETGMGGGGGAKKTAPLCVDVEVGLEDLFWGTVKVTRKSRESVTDFRLKISRGEIEGTTFWFKGEGEKIQGQRNTDLVFVLVQRPHGTFERIGDDLWYKAAGSLPAERLYFVAAVPTIEGGTVLASGNTLGALLGYDRSGVGEAVVRGLGMPLRDGSVGLSTAGGLLASGWHEADQSLKAAAAPKAEVPRGDLVVKFNVDLPSRRPRLRLFGGLLTPPVALLTPSAGGGLPAAALSSLLQLTLLPAAVEALARRRASGGRSPPRPSAVCLRVGGTKPGAPSDAARQAMDAVSAVLPALAWEVVHLVGGLEHPLLDDEAARVQSATFLLLEAQTDANAEPHPAPRDVQGAAAPGRAWTVVRAPGVRVRSSPSLAAAVVGFRRRGERLQGVEATSGWLALAGGEGHVMTDGGAAGWGALLSSRGGGAAAVAAASRRAAGGPVCDEQDGVAESDAAERLESAAADADLQSCSGKSGEALLAADEAEAVAGCEIARELLSRACSECVWQCHCAGGVLMALGQACVLLGQPAKRRRPLPGRKKGTDVAPSPPHQRWPSVLPYHVVLQSREPPLPTPGDAVAVGAAWAEWRHARSLARQSGSDDGPLGFSAVALHPGSVAAALPSSRFAVRNLHARLHALPPCRQRLTTTQLPPAGAHRPWQPRSAESVARGARPAALRSGRAAAPPPRGRGATARSRPAGRGQVRARDTRRAERDVRRHHWQT